MLSRAYSAVVGYEGGRRSIQPCKREILRCAQNDVFAVSASYIAVRADLASYFTR
jgi:hypothetical protein